MRRQGSRGYPVGPVAMPALAGNSQRLLRAVPCVDRSRPDWNDNSPDSGPAPPLLKVTPVPRRNDQSWRQSRREGATLRDEENAGRELAGKSLPPPQAAPL